MNIDFKWNQDTLIAIGASRSGKSDFVKQVIKPCKRMIVLDSNHEYAERYGLKKVKNPLQVTLNSALQASDYTLSTLNKFIIASRQFTNCLIVFEDIDLFLKNVPETQAKNLQINGRHQGLGQIIVSHRLVGLPLLMIQKADYLVMWKVPKMLEKNENDKWRSSIPTIDLHSQLSTHSKIVYRMKSEVAKPIHLDQCNCAECILERSGNA